MIGQRQWLESMLRHIHIFQAFIYNKMSHLRDIQRLRQTRNSQPLVVRAPQKPSVDIYNINFDKLEIDQRSYQYPETQHRPSIPREIVTQRQSHKRGNSNNTNEPDSPALSLYSVSLKGSMKGTASSTSRKQRNISTNQFESMGIQVSTSRQRIVQVGLSQFERICPIGKGGFGKVWKVESKKTRQIFAMKEMYKAKIILKKSISSVMNQRNLLARVRHHFFINMTYAFQDRQHIYLIMDYVNGGDLRYHIGRRRRFTEIQTKFFLANLIVALEYLHGNKIIHRDIKPQNIVLDSQGYLRITDLGVSREFKQQNFQDTSGTPGYMAPQVLCRKNHSYTADYFAVGVMAYQFMLGKRPYIGRNRKQIRDQVLSKQACIKPQQLPNRWSLDALDFINQLLQRNPKSRLGYGGIDELKRHDWMKNVDFIRLQRRQIKAPYVPPSIEQNYDDYKDQISEDTVDDNLEENMLMLRDEQVQGLFEGYQYEAQNGRDRRKNTNNI